MRLFKNGVAVGIEKSVYNADYISFSDDITVTAGDVVELKAYMNDPSYGAGFLHMFQISISNSPIV